MDRFKTKLFTTCGLILLVSNPKASISETSIGEITQSSGTVTFLSFTPPNRVKEVKVKDALYPEGSYLTQANAILTAKMLDGSWIRLSPKSKMAMAIDHTNKSITIHLFTGSLKALVSKNISPESPYKLIVKSGDTYLESSEAKFSVVRHPFFNDIKAYVEKGVVTAYRERSGKSDFQHVHTLESLTIDERSADLPHPRKLGGKEIRFIKKANYLK